jgi:hypothetical protein
MYLFSSFPLVMEELETATTARVVPDPNAGK